MSNTVPAFAATIIAQLGGQRIFAMAFESAMYSESDRSVTFHVAKSLRRMTRDKITHVTIKLDETRDLYALTYHAVRGRSCKVAAEIDGVDAENLRSNVTFATGILLSLGSMQSPRVVL